MRETRGRARLGLLVPFTNTNCEPDFALMAPSGVSLHVTRMGGYDADEIPDEGQMQGLGTAELEGALSLLMGAKPDAVLYACTSATLTHGPAFDHALAERIEAQSNGAQSITAAGAVVSALQALGATRIGFASPYVPAINDLAIDFLQSEGITAVARAEVDAVLDNDGQGALTPAEVKALGTRAAHPNADAIVLSCTDMRAVETISALEAELDKPVVTSNQAMMFVAARALGLGPIHGFGQLLEAVA